MEVKLLAKLANYPAEQGPIDRVIKTHQDYPWLGPRGIPLSDEDLFIVSRFWDDFTWERYLQTLESPRLEPLLRATKYDKLAAALEYSVLSQRSCAEDELIELFERALEVLPEKQRKVIIRFFWEGKTEREIAQEMKINPAALHRLKNRALNRIKKIFQGGSTRRI